MILGLHHAQITISKGAEEEDKNFYCNLLGLEEIENPVSLSILKVMERSYNKQI